MKASVIVVALAMLSGSQAIAGKRLSFLTKWTTPSSNFYHPRISRYLIVGGLSVGIASIGVSFLSPEMARIGMKTAVAGNFSILGGALWAYIRSDRVTEVEQVGTEVLYLDDRGNLKRGEVTSATLASSKLRIEGQAPIPIVFDGRELQIEAQVPMMPIDFKIVFNPEHADIYRSVEVLAGNAEALRHVGYVVNVFDEGFYELELLAEVDPSQPHVEHVAIEPYRIIIDENVPPEEGGFRFSDKKGVSR